jgi:N-acetyl-anhydromuramyl-L-alanine amidase AmpD
MSNTITTKKESAEWLFVSPSLQKEQETNIFQNKTSFKIKVLTPLVAYSGPATSEAAKEDPDLLSDSGVDSVYLFKGRIMDNRMAHVSFLEDPCDSSIANSPQAEIVGALHSNILLSNVGDFPNISVGDIVHGELDTGNNNLYNLQYINMTSVSDIFKVEDIEKKLENCYDLKSEFESNWLGSTNNNPTNAPFQEPDDISPYGLNYGSYRLDSLDTIAIHYSAGPNDVDGTIRSLKKSGNSYHFIVDHNGAFTKLIDEEYTAWHDNSNDNNSTSIGISFLNWGWDSDGAERSDISTNDWVGSGYYQGKRLKWEPYTSAQIQGGLNLVRDLISLYPQIKYIYGHEDSKNKADPGPLFDQHWSSFSDNLGLERKYPPATANRPIDTTTPQKGITPNPDAEPARNTYDDKDY